MNTANLGTLDALDRLAGVDSPLHRVDPRAKVAVCLAFLLAVASAPLTQPALLLPFAAFPILAFNLGNLPLRPLLRRLLWVLPLVLGLAALEPWLDPRPMALGPWIVSAGWITLGGLLFKALLSASAALLLAASTSFPALCGALQDLGVPRAFTRQLLFLWRYAGVLADEAGRLLRARDQRCPPRSPGRGPRIAARLIGVLLVRALERAERIHTAMLCRGYSGDLPGGRPRAFGWRDAAFTGAALAAIAAARFLPLGPWLGAWVTGAGA